MHRKKPLFILGIILLCAQGDAGALLRQGTVQQTSVALSPSSSSRPSSYARGQVGLFTQVREQTSEGNQNQTRQLVSPDGEKRDDAQEEDSNCTEQIKTIDAAEEKVSEAKAELDGELIKEDLKEANQLKEQADRIVHEEEENVGEAQASEEKIGEADDGEDGGEGEDEGD